MANAILVGIVGLVLFLQGMVRPSPALAVSAAECEAWLCLPGGFSGAECTPARQAAQFRDQSDSAVVELCLALQCTAGGVSVPDGRRISALSGGLRSPGGRVLWEKPERQVRR